MHAGRLPIPTARTRHRMACAASGAHGDVLADVALELRASSAFGPTTANDRIRLGRGLNEFVPVERKSALPDQYDAAWGPM